MLSKPATMLLGLIWDKPLNAYEIIKLLKYMNVKWWLNIADSTVYATLKTLEKRALISGVAERVGNMPDRTIYTITEKGEKELRDTLKKSILQFDYDTNVFSIAAFFLNIFDPEEQIMLLQQRIDILQSYRKGIETQDTPMWEKEVLALHVANLKRMIDLVDTEITGTTRLLETCKANYHYQA